MMNDESQRNTPARRRRHTFAGNKLIVRVCHENSQTKLACLLRE
jgi:hypothetical protein